MALTRWIAVSVVVLVSLVCAPAVTFGQNAGIAGVVRDSTGAVLPGVTVEAMSPELIEKVRAVTTDDQGQYKIVELPPGVYVVSFALPGFSTLRREGIELTTGFTATVSGTLAVGALEETVVVSGETPVVDVHNVRQQRVMTDEVIDILPTGRTSTGLAALVPGVSVVEGGRRFQDVGGSMGEGSRLVIHGGRSEDMHRLINGLPFNNTVSPGTGGVRPDVGSVEEVVLNLSANPAEYQRGGVVLNLIPKDGGNTFSGQMFSNFANAKMQSDNFSDELRDRGLRGVNRLDHTWDVGFPFGGPIVRDKLWFFASLRYFGSDNLIAGTFHDSDLTDLAYTPDLNRQAHDVAWIFNQAVRLTWQASPKNKFGAYLARQPRASFSQPPFQATAPEALTYQNVPRNRYMQFTWTSPVTSRLLLEAGGSIYDSTIVRPLADGVSPDSYSIRDTGTGFTFNAPASISSPTINDTENMRFAMSYVTGSHAFKVGMTQERGTNSGANNVNNAINLTFLNGRPTQITLNVTPRTTVAKYNWLMGLYAQDQWTLDRLTLNMGIRYDYHNSSVPEQDTPEVRFLAARHFDEVKNVPNWKDVSPRLSGSLDVFGNGKTAIKGSVSRYLIAELAFLAAAVNPVTTVTNNANRTWTDLNGNFTPECDFLNPVANGECTGPLGNLNFGKPNITTFYDSDYTEGFGKRSDNWEASIGLQHELMPLVAVDVGYFRRWYGNFIATDNRSTVPGDYDPYCITAPSDPRLPKGGGYEICGLVDVNPSKFGQSDTFITLAEKFGKETEVFHGIDLSVNARLTTGTIVQGGISTGKTIFDSCDVIGKVETPARTPSQNNPRWTVAGPSTLHCHQDTPFLTQFKLLGAHTFPRGIEVSATFQRMPGPEIRAAYTARNAEIAPSLGRNLSAGANGTAPVELVGFGDLYGDVLYQTDARLAKVFTRGRVRIKGMLDLYNMFNANPVLEFNTTFGSAWQSPLAILQGRMVKVGVQVNY